MVERKFGDVGDKDSIIQVIVVLQITFKVRVKSDLYVAGL